MQSVMQMSVARFASRNPCISRMPALPKKPNGAFRLALASSLWKVGGIRLKPESLRVLNVRTEVRTYLRNTSKNAHALLLIMRYTI